MKFYSNKLRPISILIRVYNANSDLYIFDNSDLYIVDNSDL